MKKPGLLAWCILVTTLAVPVSSTAQIESRIRQQYELSRRSTGWFEGFSEAIRGEIIHYNSVRDDCMDALLTRATSGDMAVEWWTAPLPEAWSGEYATFFWISGIDLNEERCRFDLFINDMLRFSFHTSQSEDWIVEGEEGATLAFTVFKKDQYEDGFGYMRMRVPSDWLLAGRPLHLKVVGEKADSRIWFMVFKCPDALAYFQEQSEHEGWFDLTVESQDEEHRFLFSAPEHWSGRTVTYTLGSELSGSFVLEPAPRAARGMFQVRLPMKDMSELPLSLSSEGENLLDLDRLFRDVDEVAIRARTLWIIKGSERAGDRWKIEARTLYKPQLTTALEELSSSRMRDGVIHIINSSHQDIAWMDDPEQCAEDRDLLLITPALTQLGENPDYRLDMENVLMLREYLERHPDRKEELYKYMRQGRVTWGASYSAPYEEMYSGEGLIRQFYLGRKWLKREFPGCDAVTYWNVDVPGRSLQMPQILSRAGVRYLVLSRHGRGVFRWLSPDGSGVTTYSPGHYGESLTFLKRDFFDAAAHIAGLAYEWGRYNTAPGVELVIPLLSDEDMSPPRMYYDLIKQWENLHTMEDEKGNQVELKLPRMEHSTATRFLDRIVVATPDMPTIVGERPNVWVYIHGPSHHQAISAGRKAWTLLTAAEKFSAIEAQLTGSFSSYPQDDLTGAWEAAIYPDHGWGGKDGHITDELFRKKFEFARDEGRRILKTAIGSIASRINTASGKALPLVVFNTLSWKRSDPVSFRVDFTMGETAGLELTDSGGRKVPFQLIGKEIHPDGTLKTAEICFVAVDVPSIGYSTYYIGHKSESTDAAAGDHKIPDVIENRFYTITLGHGGIRQIRDRQLQEDLFDTTKFLGGELFTMQSVGNGAGEFSEIQQPTMEGFDRLSNHRPGWRVIEAGPVRTVLSLEQVIDHVRVVQRLIAYEEIKRLDLETDLLEWDGTIYREFRLAFPVRINRGKISYEVPFGVVEVGRDEIPGAAGERYIQECAQVSPRGIRNWIGVNGDEFGLTISSSVAVCDYLDPSNDALSGPVIQPILLASRESCHWEGNSYLQTGDHYFRFSLLSHAPGWKNGYRFGREANEPLQVVIRPGRGSTELPEEYSFVSIDSENVMISTIKKCEDDDTLIIRLFDAEGRDSDVKISLFGEVQQALLTDIIEEGGRPLVVEGRVVTLGVGHHSIETVKIKMRAGASRQ